MHSQVLSMSSKSGGKRTYVWAKAERRCVLLAIGVLSVLAKSGDKRTFVWAKAERTCVLLAIRVLSVSSKSRDKRTYVWAKAMCPFSYWRAREGNSECTGKFHQSPETKKK